MTTHDEARRALFHPFLLSSRVAGLCHHYVCECCYLVVPKSSRDCQEPALESGCRRLILWLLIFGNIPWLILGAALELPRAFSGPLLIAFGVTLVVYWIAGLYWLVFRGGAEYLAAYPGIFRGSTPAPRTIKIDVLVLAGTALVVTGLAIGSFVRDAGLITSVFVVIVIIISGFVFSGKPWVRL